MKRSALQRSSALRRTSGLNRVSALKKTPSKRNMASARAKVATEPVCRLCGRSGRLDPAHIIARAKTPAGEGEHEDNILALCRTCHRKYDERRCSILEVLTVEEQVKAVELAGGLMTALQRVTGDRYVPEREAA